MIFRAFTAVHLTGRTLWNIFARGVDPQILNLSMCHIRNLPQNMFYFLQYLKQASKEKFCQEHPQNLLQIFQINGRGERFGLMKPGNTPQEGSRHF